MTRRGTGIAGIAMLALATGCFESSEVCRPECGSRVCGPDPVCNFSCGTCGRDEVCRTDGVCWPASCETTPELCGDAIDNDCDGETDEDFSGVGSACSNQGCPGMIACSPDRLATVCDAPGPAPDDATCDGLDDDCDGETDEDAGDRLCELQAGVCAGTRQGCLAGGIWSECDYGPSYSEGVDDGCDRTDNDCDGETDEDVPPILEPESGAQATDGIDNNCNGLVDEPGGVLVRIPNRPNVWIDAYETSVWENADCTGTRYGVIADDYPLAWPLEGSPGITLYACSVGGVMPSGYLSWYRARWACEAQGKRLCDQFEWGYACGGQEQTYYPYGNTFIPGVCNDAWYNLLTENEAPAPAGSHLDCQSDTGAFDMSGNMTEWLSRWHDDPDTHAWTAGFSYLCEVCANGVLCETCDRDDLDFQNDVRSASSCQNGPDALAMFDRREGRDHFGARCCLEGP